MAAMIFGPCLSADLTSRWFLSAFPRFKGLHPEAETGPWEAGQAAYDVTLKVCGELGLNRNDLLRGITNTSSVKPHASIASIILLAGSLSPLSSVMTDEMVLSRTVIADAMPVLTIAMGGSAIDAGTALTWFLIHAAQQGSIDLEYDQSTFFLEASYLILPSNLCRSSCPSSRWTQTLPHALHPRNCSAPSYHPRRASRIRFGCSSR